MKIKTKVVHSTSKPEWKIVSTTLGTKHKIATVPYTPSLDVDVIDKERDEALAHANKISELINNSDNFYK